MASLKALRNRINSVISTRKITRAMQMVAAAKLRRAQQSAEAARPYATAMEGMLASIASSMEGREGAPELLAGRGSSQRHLLVIATAERGLCGSFNASIARLARQRATALLEEGKTVRILTVGRKGRDALKREYEECFVDHVDLSGARRVAYTHAEDVAKRVIRRFESGEDDVCSVFFSRFHSVIRQDPTELQLIPARIPEGSDRSVHYEYEEDEKAILQDLLPRNIAVQVFGALLENAASEQGARMTAMDSATRNAGEMIDRLTLEYNRTRQAAITTELIEIISGAEAL